MRRAKKVANRVKSALVTVTAVNVPPVASAQNRVIVRNALHARHNPHKRKPPLNRVALTLQRKPNQQPASPWQHLQAL